MIFCVLDWDTSRGRVWEEFLHLSLTISQIFCAYKTLQMKELWVPYLLMSFEPAVFFLMSLKKDKQTFSWMSRSRMGECSLHSEASVLIVCILRQRYSHLPCNQSYISREKSVLTLCCSSNVTSFSWASSWCFSMAYHKLLAALLRSHREQNTC